MPACQRFLTTTVLLSVCLLSACSRDNPLSEPDPFPAVAEACLYPAPAVNMLEDMSLDGTSVPIAYDPDTADYQVETSFFYKQLILNLDIFEVDTFPSSVSAWNSFVLNHPEVDDPIVFTSSEELPEMGPITLNWKFVKDDPDSPLSEAEQVIAADTSTQVIENDLFVADQNTLTIMLEAEYEVPVLDTDCEVIYDANGDGSESVRKRSVSVEQEYTLSITRQNLDGTITSELDSSALELDQDDRFGSAVAVSGSWLAVAVPGDDSGARGIFSDGEVQADLAGTVDNNNSLESGAVFLYQLVDGNWQFSHFIKAPNAEAGDGFGRAIALVETEDGQAATLVVSAPSEDSIAEGIMVWQDADDNGISDDQVVASALSNNLASQSGAVYSYRWSSGDEWRMTHYIKPRDNVPGAEGFNDAFGFSLAMDESQLAIGAPKEDSDTGNAADSSAPNAGAVYLYSLDGSGTPTYLRIIKAGVAETDDNFGTAVAIDDDVLVVGAPGESSDHDGILYGEVIVANLEPDDPRFNTDAPNSGAMYVFERSGEIWSQAAYVKAPNSDAGDLFGSSVAVSDQTVFVGAPNEDSRGTYFGRDLDDNSMANSGAIYGYRNSGGNWARFVYGKLPEQRVGAKYGTALAINTNSVVATAPGFDFSEGGAAAQGVYVLMDLRSADAVYVEGPSIWNTDPDNPCTFNVLDAGCEDYVLLPDYGWSGDANGLTQVEQFGAAVTMLEDRIVVAAPGSELVDGTANAGAVHVIQ